MVEYYRLLIVIGRDSARSRCQVKVRDMLCLIVVDRALSARLPYFSTYILGFI